MSEYGEDTVDVYNERFPRARKAHRCSACKETIDPGHVYARISLIGDGSVETVKRCLRCQAIHQHLRDVSTQHNRENADSLWPAERLDCGQEYTRHWGREPPPEIAALAFVTAEEMQMRKDGAQ